MRYFYSPATRGFYVDEVHGQSMPTDAIYITEDKYRYLLEQTSLGMIIYLNAEKDLVAIKPSPLPDLVPDRISRYQARAVLMEAGLLDKANAYFNSPGVLPLHKLAWDEAPTLERKSEALKAGAKALNLDEQQLDQLFIQASKVQ